MDKINLLKKLESFGIEITNTGETKHFKQEYPVYLIGRNGEDNIYKTDMVQAKINRRRFFFSKNKSKNEYDIFKQAISGDVFVITEREFNRIINDISEDEFFKLMNNYSIKTDRILKQYYDNIGFLYERTSNDSAIVKSDWLFGNIDVHCGIDFSVNKVCNVYKYSDMFVTEYEITAPEDVYFRQFYFKKEPIKKDVQDIIILKEFEYNIVKNGDCMICADCGKSDVYWRNLDTDIIKAAMMFMNRSCGCTKIEDRDFCIDF